MTHRTAVERIDGWKDIARYLGRDVTTAIRWERQKGLPVHRVPGGKRQPVFCYAHEIDAWLHARQDDSGLVGLATPPEAINPPLPEKDDPFPQIPRSEPETQIPSIRKPFAGSAGRLMALALGSGLIAVLALLSWRVFPGRIQFGGEVQITCDGLIKSHLVTDGSNLYMGEWRDGRIVLATVSVHGGSVREIPTPFVQTFPVAVSRDGERLLALVGEGEEQERALWVIPVHGGAPRRLGNLLCHNAAWSPDEQRIAYTVGNGVYVASADGKPETELYRFTRIPQELRWSLDGKRVVTRLRDSSTWTSSIWELVLRSDGLAVTSMRPLITTPRDYDSISPMLDGSDNFFLGTGGRSSEVFTVRRSPLGWVSGAEIAASVQEAAQTSDFALDRTGKKLYLLKDTAARNEAEWYDARTREFHPFLPGVSVRDIDFSPDGRRIVYVQDSDNTLWNADRDGKNARLVATPGMKYLELPRWSPDGKQIAFMARMATGPYRIFVIAATGGSMVPASHGSDNQGAPTWSPDGRRLACGRVLCQEDATCAIEEINLATGEQTTIAGSEGLSTARWSPDGRFIAALRADQHSVWLFDGRTRVWKKLADGVNGNDLAWARDSRSIYASRPEGQQPGLLKISTETGVVDPVVDLTAFSKLNGRVDTWFAVTPDDSFLFLRIVAGDEVYALSYR